MFSWSLNRELVIHFLRNVYIEDWGKKLIILFQFNFNAHILKNGDFCLRGLGDWTHRSNDRLVGLDFVLYPSPIGIHFKIYLTHIYQGMRFIRHEYQDGANA